MNLSDKPERVEITERDTDEVFPFCRRCNKGKCDVFFGEGG